jgi:glycosyltransferase involved in cell wall biosynthesis
VDPPKCLCGGSGRIPIENYPYDDLCGNCNGSGKRPSAPLPQRFVVGYLGACGGPDKGLVYLLHAWKLLDYRDGSKLLIAGKDSASPYLNSLINQHFAFVHGQVEMLGWQEDVSEFYDRLSVYVQPSVTEGWGIEVTEAMAHGRLALCSEGAGAADMALETFPQCDPTAIASKINDCKIHAGQLPEMGGRAANAATLYTWDIVRERYCMLWQSLLGEGRMET